MHIGFKALYAGWRAQSNSLVCFGFAGSTLVLELLFLVLVHLRGIGGDGA